MALRYVRGFASSANNFRTSWLSAATCCHLADASLDYLVGTGEQARRDGEAERLRGLKVDEQLELDWGLDGKLARLRTLEDAIDVGRRAPIVIRRVISVGQHATGFSEL